MSLDIQVGGRGVLGMEGEIFSDLVVTHRPWCRVEFLESVLGALWWWLQKSHSRRWPPQPH